MLGSVRTLIAKTDLFTGGERSTSTRERKAPAALHTLNAVVQGANVFVSGTPAALFTIPAAITLAAVQWIGGAATSIRSGMSLGAGDNGKGIRRDALLNFAAGISAAIPGVGQYVNGAVAGYHATHAANNVII